MVLVLSLEPKAGLPKLALPSLSWAPSLLVLPGPGHSVRQFCLLRAHGQGHRSPAPAACLLLGACGFPSAERKEQPEKEVNPYQYQRAISQYIVCVKHREGKSAHSDRTAALGNNSELSQRCKCSDSTYIPTVTFVSQKRH